MAINFPNSPSNGDAHAGFIYNSTKGVWEASAASVPMSDSPPANPAQGDLWFDSSVAKTYIYYNDGSSSQWVQLNPSGGSDGVDGADATGGGESPVILTEPPTTTQLLNSDGTTSTVTMTAQDPEGFDITYGIAYKTANNARPAQLSADTTINQTTGTYTFTPSTTASDAGTFKARLSASDGVTTTTRFVNFNLTFQVDITFSASEPGVTTDLTNSIVFSASGSNGGSGMAQSANLQTGKYYFEMSLTSVNTEIMIGFAPESITDPGWNASSDLAAVYSANGNWYPGGSVNAVSGGYTNGDVLMLAYDTANRQVWVGKNGSWVTNPSSTGKSIGGTGEMTLIAGSAAGAGASLSANILVGSSNLNYSVPTGFSAY